MAALGLGATVGVMLPFSRSHESEADEYGLYMAATAGYDPQAAVGLWQRMGALGGSKPPEWLSTHPSEETRIARLNEAMPKALDLYREALARRDAR
jgi:predicted Zn-dependent protease